MVPHSSQDDDRYRSDEERATAAARDPLARLRSRLVSDGILDEGGIEREVEAVAAAVRADLDRALAEPEPDGQRYHEWMHS
jgi:pyruvate dehydrogenase E1 component alpha subunit